MQRSHTGWKDRSQAHKHSAFANNLVTKAGTADFTRNELAVSAVHMGKKKGKLAFNLMPTDVCTGHLWAR